MRFLVVAILVLAGALVQAQDTPEAAVRAFIDAWNAREVKTLVGLIAVPESADRLRGMEEITHLDVRMEASDFEVFVDADTAVAIYQLAVREGDQVTFSGEDVVPLKRTDSGWKLRPPRGGQDTSRRGLTAIARLIANPILIQNESLDTQRKLAGSKLRQLGIAVVMYSGDHDDRLEMQPSQAAVRKALQPYVVSEEIWQYPGKPDQTFSFNVKLTGHSFSEMDDPGSIVMFYEGSKGALDFSHDGRAWVCFADGHTRLIKREDAASLRWTVK